MESCELFKSENPKLSPKEYIEKYELENVLSEMLNTLVSKKNKKPEIFMVNNFILVFLFLFYIY